MHLAELIQSYFEFRNHASKEDEVNICCPFCVENGHSPDEEFKLGINTATEVGHCHRCDWRSGGRTLYNSLADEVYVHDDYETSRDATEGTAVVKEKRTSYKLKKVKLPREYEPLWPKEDLDAIGKKARRYVRDRGITSKQIRKHRLGFCAAGRYGYRIILPIYYRKACVGFTARTFVAKAEPKYLISDGEKFLYNYPNKRKAKCILVEGPFDVLNIERYISDYDCIGRQGSALTDLHLRALSKYDEIVLWNDPDPAGVQGAVDVSAILKRETEVKLFGVMPKMGDFKDPGDLSKEEIRDCISRIKPWSEALVNKLYVSVLF